MHFELAELPAVPVAVKVPTLVSKTPSSILAVNVSNSSVRNWSTLLKNALSAASAAAWPMVKSVATMGLAWTAIANNAPTGARAVLAPNLPCS